MLDLHAQFHSNDHHNPCKNSQTQKREGAVQADLIDRMRSQASLDYEENSDSHEYCFRYPQEAFF